MDTNALRLRASLHGIGLLSPDADLLARFYGDALGYEFSADDHGLFGTAPDRRLHISPGTANRLDFAAYAVPSAAIRDALARRLGKAGIAAQWIDYRGFAGQAVAFADPDGNRFVFGVAAQSPPEGARGGTTFPARIQHVVFATTDLPRLLTFFTDVVGFTLTDRVLDEQGTLKTVFLRCSAEHHSLALFAASENRLDHHCYEAGDWGLIRDWADHLAARRIPLKWGPGRHGPGNNLFLFVHDPDGNWLEISAELEQVDEDRPVSDWRHEERTLNSWGIGLLRS